jgi:heptose I phosphotransferase
MLVLPEAWLQQWRGGDVFEHLFALQGKIYKQKYDHKTLRFTDKGKGYFAKLHWGVGWKEICSQLLRLRTPVLGAENEARAIERLQTLGIATTPLVGYGTRGRNPARRRSFVITEELPSTISLEDFCRDWAESPPPPALKHNLIAEVAEIVRTLHANGVNHRDLYICHFLLDISNSLPKQGFMSNRVRLFLIDLHRVQLRKDTPRRWKVKDIAALYFSAMDLGLTERDLLRFARIYCNKPLKAALNEDRVFWRRIRRRAGALYRKYERKRQTEHAS